jgi:hypothetical protein
VVSFGFLRDREYSRFCAFQSHKDKIYPRVKATFIDDSDRGSNEIEVYADDEPIFKLWMGDLAIFYAVDIFNTFATSRELKIDNICG